MTFIGKKTTSEIATALGLTERGVRDRASREKWRSVQMNVRGGRQKFYLGPFLPTDVKKALASTKTCETGLALIKADARPVSIPDVHAPDRSKDIGLAKYNLVHAYRRELDAAPWGQRMEAGAAFMLAYNSRLLMPNVYNVIGDMNEKTVRSLDKKLKDAGDDYTALCDGRGGWKKHGTTKYRGRDLSPAAQRAFLQCYVQQSRPSIEMAIRAARKILENEKLVDDCSDTTYRRWLKDFEVYKEHVICLGREGEKAYQDKYAPYASRDASLLNVGDCLVGDGKVLNFTIQHPDTGKPVRMILIVFLDWASRCPVGWQLMPTENTIAIAAAFRAGCVNLGMYPRSVYVDNGKAFKAKFFAGTKSNFDNLPGLYGRVGTAVYFAKPYNGKAKVVERFFRTVQMQLECLVPSYCGSAIHLKPAHMNRNEKFLKAWHEAKTRGYVPTVREASHMIERYFHWVVRQPHEGLGGRSPFSVLEEGRGPGIDAIQLNHDFLWREWRLVRRCRVTLHGIEYEDDCLHGISTKIKILVMYDMSDLWTIHCYMPEGQYLGEARPVAMLHPLAKLAGDELSVEKVKQTLKRHAQLKKSTKRDLLELGIHGEDVVALNALEYNPKVAVVKPVDNTRQIEAAEPKMSEEEVKRLEGVRDSAGKEREISSSASERPKHLSEFKRYEWAFYMKYRDRCALSKEDEIFMAHFETTEEYLNNYRNSFEEKKALYDGIYGDEFKQA